MQGLHHQQQQLVALLSAALPKEDSKSSEVEDSARISALNSLHRAIVHPNNSLLVYHTSSFLSQGLFELLSDKSYAVRRATAITYGSLCSVVCSTSLSTNGRQNLVLVDHFISWALPLIREVNLGNGRTDFAFEGVKEFLNNGEAMALERYIFPILKACQELLEDERTPLNLLHQLLGLLTCISLKFAHCFQPHFVDIIDLLLGWALLPDLSESERCIITDAFLKFQNHWINNLQFSLGLMSKFLGDMDVLLQDESLGTQEQYQRWFALFSCYLAVLQAIASGMMQMNAVEQITEPLLGNLPQLMRCLSLVGQKFGGSKWMRESLKCLLLLGEILSERFSAYYSSAFDTLFQNLEGFSKVNASELCRILKTNLQLLSLQKLSLLPSSVQKVLHFDSPLSQSRLHPNNLVTGISAATYLFLTQHKCVEVVNEAIGSLMEELRLLKNMLEKFSSFESLSLPCFSNVSKLEMIGLVKFDLQILLSSVSLEGDSIPVDQVDYVIIHHERSSRLISFIFDNFDPFKLPISCYLDLQAYVIKALHKLSMVEFQTRCLSKRDGTSVYYDNGTNNLRQKDVNPIERHIIIDDYLSKYNRYIVKSMHAISPLSIKFEVLDWIQNFSHSVMMFYIDKHDPMNCSYSLYKHTAISNNLLFSLLDAASDRETKVRSRIASLLELLVQAQLVHPRQFYSMASMVLEKLNDPDISVKNAYVKLLSIIVPITLFIDGGFKNEMSTKFRCSRGKTSFSLNSPPQQLNSQQLVSILSYISQRWRTPLSSWIQRLVLSCRASRGFVLNKFEEPGNLASGHLATEFKGDETLIDQIFSVNNLAAAWWSIHEAARHCITLRLRTNLGGPTQTFAALERKLLDISHALHVEMDQNDNNLSYSSRPHLLPMRLLLEFVESLKKNVYNASDGSFTLPCVSRQSTLFFHANKKVCEEWFSRICDPMMNAGVALQCHSATINYCTLRLKELYNIVITSIKDKSRTQAVENLQNIRVKYVGDICRVVRHASLALCKNGEPEVLLGLQKWVHMNFSSLFVDNNNFNTSHMEKTGPFSWITGLVYQAQGQYEMAAAHFSHLLQCEEALSYMGSDGVQFIISRVIECYSSLTDWKSLEMWMLELQSLRAKYSGKNYSGALTTTGNDMNAIHALARFDEGDTPAAWSYLGLTPKSSGELTLNPKLALQRSEQMLLQAMLQKSAVVGKVPEEIEKAKILLEELSSVIPLDGLAKASAYATQLHCIFAFEDGCKFKMDALEQSPSLLNSLRHIVRFPVNKRDQDCNLWLKILRIYRAILPTSLVTFHLSEKLISLARKQKNFMLAHRLGDHLREHLLDCFNGKSRDHLNLSLQYESALLVYAEGRHDVALMNLWSLIRSYMVSPSKIVPSSDNMLVAKACLKLSTLLRKDYTTMNLENIILNMHSDLMDFRECELINSRNCHGNGEDKDKFGTDLNWVQFLDEIVGKAIKVSSLLCPVLGKSWIAYASWCYNKAKDCLSAHDSALCSFIPSIFHTVVAPNQFSLNSEEISKVMDVIINLFDNRSLETKSDEPIKNEDPIQSLIKKVVYVIQAVAGVTGIDDNDGECPSIGLSLQLENLFFSVNPCLDKAKTLSSVSELVNIWWSLRRRKVLLFGQAAYGYLKYLSYTFNHEERLQDNSCFVLPMYRGSSTLRATLYILNILSNYGVELRDALESELAMVPLPPWQDITPQLFARLSSHPEKIVRKQLEALLILLAKLSPWSIVYPTLVDINACEGDPPEELQKILDCLKKLHPKLVQDVQLVINGLGAITILWEELWLNTLQDLRSDVSRRINILKEEAKRISENISLSQMEKNKINATRYTAMMAPIIVALERRLASTSRKPETSHEKWFQKEYNEQLRSAILTFKIPPSITTLGDVWRPFDAIATSLAAHHSKSLVSLSDIAPELACLTSTNVPIPGVEKQISLPDDGNIVRISSFNDQVTVLSTKTKPKKLSVLGSDGKKYTYLLKGQEDLRLDARIMQLLQVINSFFNANGYERSLVVRYYSVTPISGRAGLIQWVENVTSIYSVFKAWQTRTQVTQLSSSGPGNINISIPRPSDMFYGKIIPALKEKGIRKVISRRDWPHEVKRKVLVDLMKETPRNLLQQEIWLVSEGFNAFNSKQKRFSASVAAMSMVGYILGLGDRHLDNILMDFSSGDIVHIDYNICFDKGKRLKIPEIVPFRLTQIIEATLGFTGVEGLFRANCEKVLDALQKNKDIILMLLQVFIWDPLVEWTRNDVHDEATIGGEERKGMELAVSLSLFASRVQELRVPLQEHHDLLLSALPSVQSALEIFLEILNQYEIISKLFLHADQERSNLLSHENSVKSVVSEATEKSEKARGTFEEQALEFSLSKTEAEEKAQESAKWIAQHGKILDSLRIGSLLEIKSHLTLSGMEHLFSLKSAVVAGGVPLSIVPEPIQAQCEDLDREIFHTMSQLDIGSSSVVNAIQTYTLFLQRVLPLNYITSSSVHAWAEVMQLAVTNISSNILGRAQEQAKNLIVKSHGDDADIIQKRYESLCLTVEPLMKEIEKMERDYSELSNSIEAGVEVKFKDRLLSTFSKYVHSSFLWKKEHDASTFSEVVEGLDEKKMKVFCVLYTTTSEFFGEVEHKMNEISRNSSLMIENSYSKSSTTFGEFEFLIEKCTIIANFIIELHQLLGTGIPNFFNVKEGENFFGVENQFSDLQASILACKTLTQKMMDSVLPEMIKLIISQDHSIMDAFGFLSQIRGSIDTALEQLVDIELERASLSDLEQNYFVNVKCITEKQLALEEASMKGRDYLSWEEAEELASQEEACRAQLDQLHQTWNERDVMASSLSQKEMNIRRAIIAVEQRFSSLTSSEKGGDLGSTCVLSTLAKPFSELETLDQVILSSKSYPPYFLGSTINFSDMVTTGFSPSELILTFSSVLNTNTFFIWKIYVLDSFLDSCIHEISSSIDHNLGFDLLHNVVKKKLEIQLERNMEQYIRERVVPSFIMRLRKTKENSKRLEDSLKGSNFDSTKEIGAVRKAKVMLEEYCNIHETMRESQLSTSLIKRQVKELKDALKKTILEIAQIEWMHNLSSYFQNSKIPIHSFIGDDNLLSIILTCSRPQVLGNMRTSMEIMKKAIESLQTQDEMPTSVEGQLERAMEWTCSDPSSDKTSGIPQEFYDYILKRKQLLWTAREQSLDIIKICTSILEFEASRDGQLLLPGKGGTGCDRRVWQQGYFNALTKLDSAYHSFTRAEKEWKLAQSNMEAATSSLVSATNELSIASAKAKSAAGELQETLASMWDQAHKASSSLSAFGQVARGHTALTSECGIMLEEVLAITEGVHNVYTLGNDAATVHKILVNQLSKANIILLPLEAMISKDIIAMIEAIPRGNENKMEIPSIHGQALHQSYCLKLREACQSLRSIVPLATNSVKELHSMLSRLARTASIHAGNLHKALEGLGESQEASTQEIVLSRSEITSGAVLHEYNSCISVANVQGLLEKEEFSSDDNEWISPPYSISSNDSAESIVNSDDSVISANSCKQHNDTDRSLNVANIIKITDKTVNNPFSESDVDDRTIDEKLESQNVEIKNVCFPASTIVNQKKESEAGTSSDNAKSITPSVIPSAEENKPNGLKLSVGQDMHPNNSYANCETRAYRGKNAYAISILRRIGRKLDGHDSEENRQMHVSEQVDYLIRQATSIDNLCNMYEGWTPWI